eukprot:gene46439-62115_t
MRVKRSVRDATPTHPWDGKPVAQQGGASLKSLNPNSRSAAPCLGTPVKQGGVMTEALICVGIDVSQDRLDVHIEPSGRAFPAANDAGGITRIASEIMALGHVDY